MVAIYVRWINAGKMKLLDIPVYWRDQVSKQLSGEGDS